MQQGRNRKRTWINWCSIPTYPDKVRIGFMQYHTRLYIPNSLRCYNCKKYGHHSTKSGGDTVTTNMKSEMEMTITMSKASVPTTSFDLAAITFDPLLLYAATHHGRLFLLHETGQVWQLLLKRDRLRVFFNVSWSTNHLVYWSSCSTKNVIFKQK